MSSRKQLIKTITRLDTELHLEKIQAAKHKRALKKGTLMPLLLGISLLAGWSIGKKRILWMQLFEISSLAAVSFFKNFFRKKIISLI